MLEQDNNFYLIIFSILIICLLDNIGYYREKLHFNHFRQFKSQRVNVHVILPFYQFATSKHFAEEFISCYVS